MPSWMREVGAIAVVVATAAVLVALGVSEPVERVEPPSDTAEWQAIVIVHGTVGQVRDLSIGFLASALAVAPGSDGGQAVRLRVKAPR